MIRSLMAISGLMLVVGCTPADELYCQSFGVGGTVEYGKCIAYYHQQQDAFRADRAACEDQADMTYPTTLYDNGHYAHVYGGYGGGFGPYSGSRTIRVEPDYQHNAQVDRLRMRIIEPCMQSRGWNSGRDWQAGRHAVTPAPMQRLPWQK
ncbi:MAG: hypothetical protein V4735_06365 [Pseudomonadota bacterium]